MVGMREILMIKGGGGDRRMIVRVEIRILVEIKVIVGGDRLLEVSGKIRIERSFVLVIAVVLEVVERGVNVLYIG
jgi:hypothetical protein